MRSLMYSASLEDQWPRPFMLIGLLIVAALFLANMGYLFIDPHTRQLRLLLIGLLVTGAASAGLAYSLSSSGVAVAHTSASPALTALPANPTMIVAENGTGQETLLNARVYPVALVTLSNIAALVRLNQTYTRQPGPHHFGFLAVIDTHAASMHQAVSQTQKVLTAHHITLPWAVVVDPAPAFTHPSVQLYWMAQQKLHHLTGAALWPVWTYLTRPLPVLVLKHSSTPSSTHHPSLPATTHSTS